MAPSAPLVLVIMSHCYIEMEKGKEQAEKKDKKT